MSKDDIDGIPSIVPSRDRDYTMVQTPTASASRGKGKKGGNGGTPRGPAVKSATSLLARLLITVSLVVAGVACAWAWQLQEQLRQTSFALNDYETRIADLEARLSDTDEGMSQNAAVQAAKIRELDSEVRKLWDNVWKKAGKRLDQLESTSSSHGKKIAATEKSVAGMESQVKGAASDIARLKSVAGDLERLMASARTNQTEVERVADTLNRINLEVNKLNRRVQGNEESVQAIDAFRRQMMTSVTDLQESVRILQSTP